MPSNNPRTDSSALCRRGCPTLATRRGRPCPRNMVECAQSSVPAILADRGDAVPHGQPSTIMGEARSSVPAIPPPHAARGLAVPSDRDCWAGQCPPRGAQPSAHVFLRPTPRSPAAKPSRHEYSSPTLTLHLQNPSFGAQRPSIPPLFAMVPTQALQPRIFPGLMRANMRHAARHPKLEPKSPIHRLLAMFA